MRWGRHLPLRQQRTRGRPDVRHLTHQIGLQAMSAFEMCFGYRIPAPRILGVPTKTRLKSSIKTFKPCLIYDLIYDYGQLRATLQTFSRALPCNLSGHINVVRHLCDAVVSVNSGTASCAPSLRRSIEGLSNPSTRRYSTHNRSPMTHQSKCFSTRGLLTDSR